MILFVVIYTNSVAAVIASCSAIYVSREQEKENRRQKVAKISYLSADILMLLQLNNEAVSKQRKTSGKIKNFPCYS